MESTKSTLRVGNLWVQRVLNVVSDQHCKSPLLLYDTRLSWSFKSLTWRVMMRSEPPIVASSALCSAPSESLSMYN